MWQIVDGLKGLATFWSPRYRGILHEADPVPLKDDACPLQKMTLARSVQPNLEDSWNDRSISSSSTLSSTMIRRKGTLFTSQIGFRPERVNRSRWQRRGVGAEVIMPSIVHSPIHTPFPMDFVVRATRQSSLATGMAVASN